MPRRFRRAALIHALIVLAGGALDARIQAQIQPPSAFPAAPASLLQQAGRNVTISLLTAGTADDVAAMFGHSAIWIHDDVSGRDTVFGWGEYDLRAPHFIAHFLQGLLLYRMDGQPLAQFMAYYQYYNRTVIQQQLAMSAAQKETLLSLIRFSARPENVVYRYDYFVDNCATRPRDFLDRALGGQLRVGADSLTPHSYRWQALRLMQSNKPLVLGVDIGLGEPADPPITRWQEMFLPEKLRSWVATRQVRDSTGAMHPLVTRERVLFQARRPAEPTDAPHLGPWLWLAGLVVAALLVWLGGSPETPGKRIARIAGASLAAVWAVACGILGVILTLLWTVTDHRFAHQNENLLLFNPFWLVLVVALPVYMLRGGFPRTTQWLVRAVALLSLVALAAHALTLSRQDNLPIIGLALPPALALAIIVERARILRTGSRTLPRDAA